MKISTKEISTIGILISLSFVASFIKVFQMPLGGSITAFSMFFITLTGYLFGIEKGFIAGVILGLLNFISNPFFFSINQVILDYILGFGSLGTGMFFVKKGVKFDLELNYIIGIVLRFICSSLSGYFYFLDYIPQNGNPIVYILIYNGSYIFGEGVITLFIISNKTFKERIKKQLQHFMR